LGTQPAVTQYIAILGARQTGKTTLLLSLMERMRERFPCVFIDLSVLSAQDARSCFRYLAFRLTSEFRSSLQVDAEVPTPPIETSVEFVEFLRHLAEHVPGQRIVILLDEVGALSPEVSDHFFSALRSVFTLGRSTIPLLAKFLFIFSGAVDLYALTFGHQSPLNICEKVYLHDFDRDAVNRIIDQFSHLKVDISPEARDAIYELAHGHPYLTMQLCSLLHDSAAIKIGREQVDHVAQQMLLDDDNIRHVIREVARRPLQRRRLRALVMDNRHSPFTRNDPILASLEMIGAVAPTQPCSIRNPLYERALSQYFTQNEEDGVIPESGLDSMQSPEEIKQEMFARLQVLRQQALGSRGYYAADTAWEGFTAALFTAVPAFSIVPEVASDRQRFDLVLAVEPITQGDSFWAQYSPAILVCRQSTATTLEPWPIEVVRQAQARGIKLAFVLLSEPAEKLRASFPSILYEGVKVIPLLDSKIVELLEHQDDIDSFLRDQVRNRISKTKQRQS
jgi:hypothetical protein